MQAFNAICAGIQARIKSAFGNPRRVLKGAAEYGWLGYMDGGLMLIVDGRLFAKPECCVYIDESLSDWKRVVSDWPSTWANVESGHPGVLARRLGDHVEIAQFDDSDSVVSVVGISLAALEVALGLALRSIESFAERLSTHLASHGVEDSFHRARVVAGLEEL